MGESIVIVSGRGGSGKTALAANLGTALARRGRTVLLIDADTGMRCLDIALGLESSVIYDAVDVLEGTCRLKQALIRDPLRPGLTFMAAAQSRPRAALTPDGLRGIVRRLRDRFDYILIDSPSGVDAGFDAACAGADSAILALVPDPMGVRSAQRMVGLLEQRSLPRPKLALCRVRPDLIQAGEMEPAERVMARLELETLALLGEDDAVRAACMSGKPLDAHSAAGRAYDDMARRLMGEDIPIAMPQVRPELRQRLRSSIRVLRGVPQPEPEE